MCLVLKTNINLHSIKKDLENEINKGVLRNDYPFEINLIYKLIHEHTNYEDVQWELYGYGKSFFENEWKSLLVNISALDRSLTWPCLSIFSRYKNVYAERHELTKKYMRANI